MDGKMDDKIHIEKDTAGYCFIVTFVAIPGVPRDSKWKTNVVSCQTCGRVILLDTKIFKATYQMGEPLLQCCSEYFETLENKDYKMDDSAEHNEPTNVGEYE